MSSAGAGSSGGVAERDPVLAVTVTVTDSPGRVRRHATNVLAPASILVLILVAWQFIPPALDVPAYILPTPTQIVTSLVNDWEILYPNLLVTLREVILGFLLALVVAMVLGFAIAHSQVLNRAIYPLLVASQTVPVIAIAPVFVIWFGYGITPKIVITALICFFPLTVNTVMGYQSVDPDMKKLFRAYRATRRATFTNLSWPSALPYVMTGAKVSITLAVIGATIAEWTGANQGLGYVILQASAQIMTARVFAAITLLSLSGIVLFLLVTGVERLVLPWKRGRG